MAETVLRRPSMRDRARYWFDSTMARGTAAIVAWLAVATLLFVLLGALALALVNAAAGEGGFVETMWLSLTRALDPGTMADDVGWAHRLVSFLVTVAGIFVVSALIGVLSSGIDRKLEDLRKGRSPVLETGHTLVLGWSPKLFSILAELIVANDNVPRACVVVLAPHDKVEMEDEIRARVPDPGRTRIVVRTGDPADLHDLGIVAADQAKAVIVLRPELEAGDAEVVRAVLALLRAVPGERLRAVAELGDAQSARTLAAASGGRVSTVVSTDIIALITAQVCRQAGLSVVYSDLLDFDGDEIYFAEVPALVGHTFAESLLAFEDSSVMGLRRADGHIALSPPPNTVIEPGDKVIAISRDDDAIVAGALPAVPPAPASTPPPGDGAGPEHILMLGWNDLGPRIIAHLDQHVAAGSSVRVVVDPRHVDPADVRRVESLERLHLDVVTGVTTSATCVEEAAAAGPVDHVVLLGYRGGLSASEADARTLMTLLHTRQILIAPRSAGADDGQPPSIATELLDVRNVQLAREHDTDDFVVSERLTSLMMAQLAENDELEAVFADLLDAEGSDMRLQRAESYVPLGRELAYAEAVRAASVHGEVVLGYRMVSEDDGADVVLNPPKSRTVVFGPRDQLITLSAAPVASVTEDAQVRS